MEAYRAVATGEVLVTVTDRGYQLAYWFAFQLMRAAWFITRPNQHGALVLIWQEGRLLLIRNSYQPLWSVPGGTVERGEEAKAAALRELREEIGTSAVASELRHLTDITLNFRYRKDRVDLFEWCPMSEPALAIDNREIVEARWFTCEQALKLNLQPHIAEYLAGAERFGECGREHQGAAKRR